MRYAVIGSNCFSGSHLVDALLEEPSNIVVGISRSPEKSELYLPYLKKETKNFLFKQIHILAQFDELTNFLDEFKPHYIINFSALSEVGLSNYNPVEYFQTNCIAVVKLGNYLRTKDYLKLYIQISTPEIYGSCAYPLKENENIINPSTPYAASKAAGDLYLSTIRKNFNFPVIFIRSTNWYGKHQQLYKIIPRSIIFLKQNKKIQLHGGGKAIKTWIHIKDVIRGIISAIHKGKPGEVYHFSDKKNSITNAELVKKICQLMGKDFDDSVIHTKERLGQDAKYILDYTKAQTEFGWRPEIPLTEGLCEVIQWIENNWDRISKEPLSYIHKT